MLKLLKQLYGQDDDASALNSTLANLDTELGSARRTLAEAQAAYGERLVAAGSSADYAKLEAELDERSREVARIEAARNAVEARLRTARQRDADRALGQRWATCEEQLEARHRAFDAVDRAAAALAKAVQTAERAAADVWDATPVRVAVAPGAASYQLDREFKGLMEAAHRRLDVAFTVAGMTTGSTLWEAAKGPSLAEQSRSAGALLLQQRVLQPQTVPTPAPDFPTAA